MIYEILVWIAFSIFVSYLSKLKTQFFNKDRKLQKTLKTINELKVKIHKGLEDQMEYVRQKSDAGMDFTNTVAAIIIFVIIFIFVLAPRINTLNMGLILAVTFSIIAAWIFSLLRTSYKDYAIIDTFIGYFYASIFIVYIKFIHTAHPLIMLGIGIITLWLTDKYIG